MCEYVDTCSHLHIYTCGCTLQVSTSAVGGEGNPTQPLLPHGSKRDSWQSFSSESDFEGANALSGSNGGGGGVVGSLYAEDWAGHGRSGRGIVPGGGRGGKGKIARGQEGAT